MTVFPCPRQAVTTEFATVPDLLRLVALPVFAWVAIRDIKTRRVASWVWIPLAILGGLTLVWDGWQAAQVGGYVWTHEFLLPAAISMGFVVPLAYLFWWIGGFGGADAKALLVLALLFPTVPHYAVAGWQLPLETAPLGAFSFTILTNAVIVGIVIPLLLAVRNGLAGRVGWVMFVGWPVAVEAIPERHGKLLETPRGLSRGSLDLDALRMYCRWRGLTLAELRADPDTYRDPATLPEAPNPPTDGAVHATVATDGGSATGDRDSSAQFDDPWGADAFLAAIDHTAYGTTVDDLRDGLELLTDPATERVWLSPGMPFLVPIFLGMVVAFTYGDLFAALVF